MVNIISGNFLMTCLILIFICLMIYFGLLKEPLTILFILINLFIWSSLFLVYLNNIYLAINLLIVYLGAILVLFLFVIMLSNTNITETFEYKTIFKLIICILAIKQLSNFFDMSNFIWIANKIQNSTCFEYIDNSTNDISNVANCLYTNQNLILIAAFLCLLLSLIISLALSLKLPSLTPPNPLRFN